MVGSERRVRVTIGDDRDDRRAELRWALQAAGADVVAEAVTGPELVRLSLRHQPDLIVVHPHLRDLDLEEAMPRLLLRVPATHVVVGDAGGYESVVPSNRVHVVGSLVPDRVVPVVERLRWAVPPPLATAVVCLADASFRSAVVAALAREGVVTVQDGGAAKDAYRSVHDLGPGLLVIDLALTGMGGWLHLQQLWEEHPQCRIVVSSPLGAVPLAVLEVGVAAVLAEGDIGGLRATVRRLVAGGQPAAPPSLCVSRIGSRMQNPSSW